MSESREKSNIPVQTFLPQALSATGKRHPIPRWLITALIVVVALVGVFAGFEYAASTRSALAGVCGTLSFTRHGLPCDIPLPSNTTFHSTSTGTLPEGYPVTGWVFSTFQAPDQIQRLYLHGLRADGWPCATARQFASSLFIFGTHKPDRPNTILEVAIDSYGIGEYTLAISLIQGAPLPPSFTCP